MSEQPRGLAPSTEFDPSDWLRRARAAGLDIMPCGELVRFDLRCVRDWHHEAMPIMAEVSRDRGRLRALNVLLRAK